MNILILICAVVLGFVTVAIAKKQLAPGTEWQSTPGTVKALIWVTDLLNPIIGGLILYYSLRSQLPAVAKKANTITFITFAIWIIVGIAYYALLAQH